MPDPTLLVSGSLRIKGIVNKEIPLTYIISWIKRHMSEYGYQKAALKDRILIIRSETGSGKSTVLPVEVFRILRNKDTPLVIPYIGKNVICTQPRVLTTISLANDVSGRPWNPDMVLGKTVGFQTGSNINKASNGLLFATAGVLAVQLNHFSDIDIMEMYKFILIDEAHERSQDCDIMLMLLKNFYLRNKGNKNLPFLILTSATFDTERYAIYFNIGIENTIEVVGRAYPIETHWPIENFKDYTKSSIDIALKIHKENDDNPKQADILIFVPGNKEMVIIFEGITAGLQLIEDSNDSSNNSVKDRPALILTINRDIITSQTADFTLMFEKIENLPKVFGKTPKRRIIIATIVAETGLTIDTLKYVIDCGWSRTIEIYQPYGIEGLITRPAPKSKIEQRKGRVGRMFPGIFYPLYTENVFKSLEYQQLPEIISLGIKDKFLTVICEQQKQKVLTNNFPDFKIEDILLLDLPSVEGFIMANSIANMLGFVSFNSILPNKWPPDINNQIFNIKYGCGLTELGYIASSFSNLTMEAIRVILMGYVHNCAGEDLLNIVCIMGISKSDLFTRKDSKAKAKKILELAINELFYNKFEVLEIRQMLKDEILEMLLIYEYFLYKLNNLPSISDLSTYCEEIGINFDIFMNITAKRDEIMEDMLSIGIDPFRLNENRIINGLNNNKIGLNTGLNDNKIVLNIITSIKKCIFDGYQNNILKYDPKTESYFTNQNMKVKISTPLFTDLDLSPNLLPEIACIGRSWPAAAELNSNDANEFSKKKPLYILTDSIKLVSVQNPNPELPAPLLYIVQANLISIMM